MTDITSGSFNEMPCLWLSNGQVRLAATTDRGPRIVFWGLEGDNNLFAELPHASAETSAGTYRFLGGHRLWYAPEVFDTTYWPDDKPLTVEQARSGATFTAPPDGQGIVKRLTITLADGAPEVSIQHVLENRGSRAVELAPWALSMCRMGGVALLPQPQEPADPDGLWYNRAFMFWPYSDVRDDRLMLGNRMTVIKAIPGQKNKIGYRNTDGWFAYLLDGTLFSKRFDPAGPGIYPDGGSNVEFYFADEVIELETLGPMTALQPGEQISHGEVWRLQASSSTVNSEEDALSLAQTL